MCTVPLFKCEWLVCIEWEILLHLNIVWETCDNMKQQQCDSQLGVHGIILKHFMDVDVTMTLMVFNYSGYICNFGRYTKVKLFPYFHFYTEIGIFTMHFLWNILECSFTYFLYITFLLHKLVGREKQSWYVFPCVRMNTWPGLPGHFTAGGRGRLLAVYCHCILKAVSMGLGTALYLFSQRQGKMLDILVH